MNYEQLLKHSKDYLIKQLEYSYKEIERLNNIINKAIEYIEHIPTQPVIRVFKKELLEILKGDKDE